MRGPVFGAPAGIHSSDSGFKMKAEFHKIVKLFEELEEAGESATLTISAKGGTFTIKLQLESLPSPSTTGTTPTTLPPAPGRRRRHHGAAARARRGQRAADHQAALLAAPSASLPPPDPGEALSEVEVLEEEDEVEEEEDEDGDEGGGGVLGEAHAALACHASHTSPTPPFLPLFNRGVPPPPHKVPPMTGRQRKAYMNSLDRLDLDGSGSFCCRPPT